MNNPIAFFAIFGLVPGLTAYVTSGSKGWLLIAALWVLLIAAYFWTTAFPGQFEKMIYQDVPDGTGDLFAYKPIFFVPVIGNVAAMIGRLSAERASQWVVGVSVAMLSLAIGAALIFFGVMK